MMKDGKGNQVFKFSPDGKLLMTLGKAGVAGGGNDVFSGPADVVIAQNGDIFVADGHMDGSGQPHREVLEGRDVHQGVGHARIGAG